jgi:hypothetical protein
VITVDYYGRSGNQLFQYVFARILCMQYGKWLYTPSPQSFVPIVPQKMLPSLKTGFTAMLNDHNADGLMDKTFTIAGVTHLHLHGYFQKSWYYNPYRDKIKTEIFKPITMQMDYDNIVIHLRLADYFWHKVNSVISPEWYINILKGQEYKKCYIVVEDHPTNKKYLQFITGGIRNCEVVTGGSALEDFNFIRSFDRIVCSNSTFCWWAAFLSNATKIWTFKPWMNKVGAKYMPDLAGIAGAIEADGKFYTDRELAGRDWEEYWNK